MIEKRNMQKERYSGVTLRRVRFTSGDHLEQRVLSQCNMLHIELLDCATYEIRKPPHRL